VVQSQKTGREDEQVLQSKPPTQGSAGKGAGKREAQEGPVRMANDPGFEATAPKRPLWEEAVWERVGSSLVKPLCIWPIGGQTGGG
jgi:hypothetical protein